MRGAKHGLSGVQWTFTASEDLAELREAMRLAAPQRQRRVREVALRLRLEHLATFCEDVRTRGRQQPGERMRRGGHRSR